MPKNELKLQRSALEHHVQNRKELLPPFNRLSPAPEQIFWLRDLLPEFLWIDALVQEYGRPQGNKVLNEFLTEADRFNPDIREILDGTVSAFRLIPEDQRSVFVKALSSSIERAVTRPFRYILGLYPECPMNWIAEAKLDDIGRTITEVRNAVARLFPGKDDYAGFCRALPLNRFFAHDKIKIVNTLKDTIEAIKTYPYGDKYRAEAFARNTHNMVFMQRVRENSETFAWARYFWNKNLAIAGCIYERT